MVWGGISQGPADAPRDPGSRRNADPQALARCATLGDASAECRANQLSGLFAIPAPRALTSQQNYSPEPNSGKCPGCPSVDKGENKTECIRNTGYYSATEQNEVLTCATVWPNLPNAVLREASPKTTPNGLRLQDAHNR